MLLKFTSLDLKNWKIYSKVTLIIIYFLLFYLNYLIFILSNFNNLIQKDRSIYASFSNFGRIPYGFTINGNLYWDPQNLDADMACKKISTIEIPAHPDMESPIVMVDR